MAVLRRVHHFACFVFKNLASFGICPFRNAKNDEKTIRSTALLALHLYAWVCISKRRKRNFFVAREISGSPAPSPLKGSRSTFDLRFFSLFRSFCTPSYHVQQMFDLRSAS